MYDFHLDKERYFNYQYWTARDYIIPFAERFLDFSKNLQVLEIGCAEAGVLKAFLEKGHQCTGIELSDSRIEFASGFHKDALAAGRIRFINKNIYDIDIKADLGTKFDLIILKDVIEHIPEQEKVIPKLTEFLSPGGKIFFGFPPWQMPFGGHQQICSSKLLKNLPWIHLLPRGVYHFILKSFGEDPLIIQELLEIKETGISIERFEKILHANHLRTYARRFYFLNPIYKFKFGLKPLEQNRLINSLPVFRNFFITACYYLIGAGE